MQRVKIYTLPIIEKIEKGPVLEARRLMFPSGEMAQVANGDAIPYIAYVEFSVGEQTLPRGNHYHTKKYESLYIAQGKLRAIFHDLETGELGECIVDKGDLITYAPSCAHVYIPIEHSHTIEFASHTYDAEDTFIHPFNIGKTYPLISKEQNLLFPTKQRV